MKRLQFKTENVTDQGIFTGHASVFGVVDLDNDVVEPGAFVSSSLPLSSPAPAQW